MKKIIYAFTIMSLFVFSAPSYGKEDIGSVVQLKGGGVIERDAGQIEARVREGIRLKDAVQTEERSRMKMLFDDDSVLTLGEKSRAVIKDFVLGGTEAGSSVVGLIDGAMRAVVGKTRFEVHTRTSFVSARGTVIDIIAAS